MKSVYFYLERLHQYGDFVQLLGLPCIRNQNFKVHYGENYRIISGYDCLNKYNFVIRRNIVSDVADWTFSGRLSSYLLALPQSPQSRFHAPPQLSLAGPAIGTQLNWGPIFKTS